MLSQENSKLFKKEIQFITKQSADHKRSEIEMKESEASKKEPKKRGRKKKQVSQSNLSANVVSEKNAFKSRRGSGKASLTPESSARPLPDMLIE